MRCLIVDDDELSRELVSLYLRQVALIETAVDGKDAVDKYRTASDAGTPYDLIILDILMPVMNGHEAAKQIRRLEQEKGITPDKGASIIMLSSLNTPKDIIESYVAAQSAAHLVKPVTPEKLLKTLRQLELTA